MRLAKAGADGEPFDAGISLMLFEGVRRDGDERRSDRRRRHARNGHSTD